MEKLKYQFVDFYIIYSGVSTEQQLFNIFVKQNYSSIHETFINYSKPLIQTPVPHKFMFADFSTPQVHKSLTSNKVVSEVSSHEEFS